MTNKERRIAIINIHRLLQRQVLVEAQVEVLANCDDVYHTHRAVSPAAH